MGRSAIACGAALCIALGAAGAQPVARAEVRVDLASAERSLAAGRLEDAENLLYAASRRAPRDPVTRSALGNYLASRGKLKVGAVLLEEARQFGGDARTIDPKLAHFYAWRGDWQAVAALPSARAMPSEERARARWLMTHAPARTGPDTSVVPIEPNELFGLGRIPVTVDGVAHQADVDPGVEGIVVPAEHSAMSQAQRFGARGDTTIAIAYRVSIGGQVLTNVPLRFELNARPRIGLDVLAALTPTFDLRARRLVLRARGTPPPAAEQVPFLLDFPGVRIVARLGEAPVALDTPAGRAALRGTRWTFALLSGAIGIAR